MDGKYQILRWAEAVVAIEDIADVRTRRVIRRAASLAFTLFSSTPDSQKSDFDMAFFISVLERTLQRKEIVIQELKGEECADWWDVH